MGATLKVSTGSCAVPPMLFDFYADLIERLPEVVRRERPAGDAYTVMVPVGGVAAIVPWNAQHNLGAPKAATALEAGCSVSLNVDPSTPPDAVYLPEILEAAGLT